MAYLAHSYHSYYYIQHNLDGIATKSTWDNVNNGPHLRRGHGVVILSCLMSNCSILIGPRLSYQLHMGASHQWGKNCGVKELVTLFDPRYSSALLRWIPATEQSRPSARRCQHDSASPFASAYHHHPARPAEGLPWASFLFFLLPISVTSRSTERAPVSFWKSTRLDWV
jgi:hypothetical protein